MLNAAYLVGDLSNAIMLLPVVHGCGTRSKAERIQPDLTQGYQYCRLMEIESRLLPCGLHVVGSPPTAMEAIATLVNIAEIDRPEGDPPVKGLPGILARSINRNMEEIYLNNNRVSVLAFTLANHATCGHVSALIHFILPVLQTCFPEGIMWTPTYRPAVERLAVGLASAAHTGHLHAKIPLFFVEQDVAVTSK